MAVTFRVDLGRAGVITWVTDDPGLANIHRQNWLRVYLQENVIGRFFRMIMGALAHPDTPRALAQMETALRAYSAWRIKDLRRLNTN